MLNLNPTDEQTAAADAFHAGDHLALQAGAGTGKTSTLALLAHHTRRRGRYLAYNKAIAQDAAARFPATVTCKTAHAMAYAALGHRYRTRLNGPRQPGWKTGQDLGITKPIRIGDRDLSPRLLSYATLRTVTRFCHSSDPALTHHHVPPLRSLEAPAHHDQLATAVLPFARKAWADLQNPDAGAVRFDHDHYLKMWSLTEPKINTDFLLLDEAQDTNPVVEQIFNAQRNHAQLVMVGDSAQAIYQWRGARDVMTTFPGTRLALSKSFRFGPHLAAEANRWLTIANAPCASKVPRRLPPSSARLRPPTRSCAEPTSAPCAKSCSYSKQVTASRWSGRRSSASVGPSSQRPQRRPLHLSPRTHPLPDLGRAAGLRRSRPRRWRPAATRRPRRNPRHRRHPQRRQSTRRRTNG